MDLGKKRMYDLLDQCNLLDSLDDRNIYSMIDMVKEGVAYSFFQDLNTLCSFTLQEWSAVLHLSERTLQRYKRQKKAFESVQSERILQIVMLYQKGIDVFGDAQKFNIWMQSENLALGKVIPKELLDNSFGIDLLLDELVRIEHGVLA